jgi:putative ergosteryl-3beta-O-L-aspartate hydrolase
MDPVNESPDLTVPASQSQSQPGNDLLPFRWWLSMMAIIWRELMKIGMAFHKQAPPRPAPPSFTIKIPSRISSKPGSFKLVFYVPDEYKSAPAEQRFPVVVNFHGGGFTLGTGTDDARWASSVVEYTKAVLVSVEYRLAPKYPFSVGVEDGTDAVIHLAAHADELRLDPHRIALSGFSAGGNFAFAVPLMLHELQIGSGKRTIRGEQGQAPLPSPTNQSSTSLPVDGLSVDPIVPSNTLLLSRKSLSPAELELSQQLPPLTITAIVAFYPVVDFRIPRAVKSSSNPKPALNLPNTLTGLFDACYISPVPGHTVVPLDLADPYLSPAAASDALLRDAYPQRIVLYTCEYDMLNAEGIAFGERLRGEGVGKAVKGGCIKGVPHGFDRKPDWCRWPVEAERCYGEACAELNDVFGREGEGEGVEVEVNERRQLEEVERVERFEDSGAGGNRAGNAAGR